MMPLFVLFDTYDRYVGAFYNVASIQKYLLGKPDGGQVSFGEANGNICQITVDGKPFGHVLRTKVKGEPRR